MFPIYICIHLCDPTHISHIYLYARSTCPLWDWWCRSLYTICKVWVKGQKKTYTRMSSNQLYLFCFEEPVVSWYVMFLEKSHSFEQVQPKHLAIFSSEEVKQWFQPLQSADHLVPRLLSNRCTSRVLLAMAAVPNGVGLIWPGNGPARGTLEVSTCLHWMS